MDEKTVRTAPVPDGDGARSTEAPTVLAADAAQQGVTGYLPVTAIAWCAGCRDHTEFVVPVGLPDASDDELACLYCGWAVLVGGDLRAAGRSVSAA